MPVLAGRAPRRAAGRRARAAPARRSAGATGRAAERERADQDQQRVVDAVRVGDGAVDVQHGDRHDDREREPTWSSGRTDSGSPGATNSRRAREQQHEHDQRADRLLDVEALREMRDRRSRSRARRRAARRGACAARARARARAAPRPNARVSVRATSGPALRQDAPDEPAAVGDLGRQRPRRSRSPRPGRPRARRAPVRESAARAQRTTRRRRTASATALTRTRRSSSSLPGSRIASTESPGCELHRVVRRPRPCRCARPRSGASPPAARPRRIVLPAQAACRSTGDLDDLEVLLAQLEQVDQAVLGHLVLDQRHDRRRSPTPSARSRAGRSSGWLRGSLTRAITFSTPYRSRASWQMMMLSSSSPVTATTTSGGPLDAGALEHEELGRVAACAPGARTRPRAVSKRQRPLLDQRHLVAGADQRAGEVRADLAAACDQDVHRLASARLRRRGRRR